MFLHRLPKSEADVQPVEKVKAFSDNRMAPRRSAQIVHERRTICTFARREVFSATHMSRRKTDWSFFASADANSNEVF